MSVRTKLVTAACAAVLAAGAVLAGTGPAAGAAPRHRAAPGAAVMAATARVSGVGPAAVAPGYTAPDAWCRNQGPNYYGWFGVAPGSSADGGVADDLWWDAKGSASPTPVQVYTGNGGANQQWCEDYIGDGRFVFYSIYNSTVPQCLTVNYGSEYDYRPGLRVWSTTCTSTTMPINIDQLWYVCPRSGGSINLEPAMATPSSVWLDVWGGNSDNGKSAFAAMNPLQIWSGNGQDNQRFTFFPSPGQPSAFTYLYTTGIAGC